MYAEDWKKNWKLKVALDNKKIEELSEINSVDLKPIKEEEEQL